MFLPIYIAKKNYLKNFQDKHQFMIDNSVSRWKVFPRKKFCNIESLANKSEEKINFTAALDSILTR